MDIISYFNYKLYSTEIKNEILRFNFWIMSLWFCDINTAITASDGVVYWHSTRPNMPFQRRGSCIFHWHRRAWLTIWDKVKSHGIHRLMHRKRVTCELHDSYFRLMTIKHASPKTLEVPHPDGQSWGYIEWEIELLYNSVKTGSQWVWRPVGDKLW